MNKTRKHATDRGCESLCAEGDRNGQSDEFIAGEEKGRLQGIIRYSYLKRSSRGWEGNHGRLVPPGVVGRRGADDWQCEVIQATVVVWKGTG